MELGSAVCLFCCSPALPAPHSDWYLLCSVIPLLLAPQALCWSRGSCRLWGGLSVGSACCWCRYQATRTRTLPRLLPTPPGCSRATTVLPRLPPLPGRSRISPAATEVSFVVRCSCRLCRCWGDLETPADPGRSRAEQSPTVSSARLLRPQASRCSLAHPRHSGKRGLDVCRIGTKVSALHLQKSAGSPSSPGAQRLHRCNIAA